MKKPIVGANIVLLLQQLLICTPTTTVVTRSTGFLISMNIRISGMDKTPLYEDVAYALLAYHSKCIVCRMINILPR